MDSLIRGGKMENDKQKRKTSLLPKRKDIPLLILLLPALITVIMFAYLPLSGLLVAFKDYKGKLGIFGSPWADMWGMANFVEIFTVPGLTDAIWNTLYWNILSLLIGFPLPIIFALLLDEVRHKRFKSVVQTISYLPYFLSWIAVTGMASSLLSQYGIINDVIKSITGERIIFLGDEKYFLPVYLFLVVWKSVGWDSIIYLSSISSVAPELYEAARIDGAGRVKQVWHVTLPALVPTAMILLILKVGQLFGSNFELVYGLQNPAWNDEVISTAVYNYGIGQGRYALATALGFAQGIVALVITMLANKISDKLTSISMW